MGTIIHSAQLTNQFHNKLPARLSEVATNQEVAQIYGTLKAFLNEQQEKEQATIGNEGELHQVDSAHQEALLLYIARLAYQLKFDRPNPGLAISQITQATNSNPFDLFREWPVLSAKVAPCLEKSFGLAVRQLETTGNISEWQKTLVTVSLLSKKYKDLFNKYLYTCKPETKALVLKLGWMLYLVLKAKLLPKFPDLVSCMELLVCVVNLLVGHLDKLPHELSQGSDGCIYTLEMISDGLKTDRAHVRHLMLSVNAVASQLMQSYKKEWHNCKAEHPGAPKVVTSTFYLPGLFADNTCISGISSMLEREYQVFFSKHGELDEVDVLYMDFARFASPRMTPGTFHKQQHHAGNGFTMPGQTMSSIGLGSPQRHLNGSHVHSSQRLGPGNFVSGPASNMGSLSAGAAQPGVINASATGAFSGPSHCLPTLPSGLMSPMPITQLGTTTATPITEALGSSAWLRAVTANLKSEPSPALQRYFALCSPNPGATIVKRVKEMAEAVLPSEQQAVGAFPLVQPSIAAYRREEATKLYFYVLELVMASEERVATAAAAARSNTAAAADGAQQPSQVQTPCYTTLLTSSKLHKGLMACSFEVVMACYKMASCPFPKVLDIIRLHAFDLIKIVQTYVRHMPGMPLELKRHLYLMEERTVETLAWQSGSSLYPLIITAMGNTGATSNHAQPAGTASGATTPTFNHNNHGLAAAPLTSAPQPPSILANASPLLMNSPSKPPSILNAVSAIAAAAAAPPTEPIQDRDGNAQQATAAQHASDPTAVPSPSKRHASSGHSMMSPLKKARGSDNSSITTVAAPQLSDPIPAFVGRPPTAAALTAMHPEMAAALTWLHDFLRKVLKLAWFRLGFLCQSLNFGGHDASAVRQRVYDTVEYAVYMQTNLMYNRHLDQLLLSALYGFCKVQHMGSITFKDIIAQYRRQPQASQAVFRSVVLSQTNPGLRVQSRGDIIAYYNQSFVPCMKQFLLKGEAASHPGHGLPPIPPAAPPRPNASPRFFPTSNAPGAASPKMFGGLPVAIPTLGSNHTSPVGSPAGRPPLPPSPNDNAAVQNAIKQTIHGFFPPVNRPATNMRPSPLGPGGISPKQPPEFGTGLKSGLRPMTGPPRFGAPGMNHNSNTGAGASPMPFGIPMVGPKALAAGGGLQQRRDMPSGIATLLRALDSANGVTNQGDGELAKESSQEEIAAPPQPSPAPMHADASAEIITGISALVGDVRDITSDASCAAGGGVRPPMITVLVSTSPDQAHSLQSDSIQQGTYTAEEEEVVTQPREASTDSIATDTEMSQDDAQERASQ